MNAAFLFGLPGKIKTLLDRLTATRAGNLDNLNATVSSRAAASTALSNAVWTNTKAGYLDGPISGIPTAFVKSVQRGGLDWSDATTYTDVTISSINTSKSMLLINERIYSPSNFEPAGGEIVSSTKLTFWRISTVYPRKIFWQVVEFY